MFVSASHEKCSHIAQAYLSQTLLVSEHIPPLLSPVRLMDWSLALVMMLWRIHTSYGMSIVNTVQDISISPKIETPAGVDLTAAEVWFVEFYTHVTAPELVEFCAPLGWTRCHNVTSGALNILYFVSGNLSMITGLATTFDDIIGAITPDFNISLVPDDEEDSNPMQPGFLELTAATWGLNRIGADRRVRTGAGSTIFVLDTGVRCTHSEFGGRCASALDMSSGSLRECNGASNCAGDAQGHGTHCAGTAGGASFGVAPKAIIKSVKVLSDQGSGSWSWSYEALDWLAAGTAKNVRPAVASMSLGGSGTQQAMKTAVDAAVNSGVVVVVAAGNSNSDACNFSPAFVPSAITVGSTTSLDSRSSFSNYGSCTDIWAPGSNVKSASHRSDTGSATLSGTSMACPHVSGAAALVLSKRPDATPAAVLAELLADSYDNALRGLRAGDTNKLPCVAEGGAPPSPAVPTPPPAPPQECPVWCFICITQQCQGCC